MRIQNNIQFNNKNFSFSGYKRQIQAKNVYYLNANLNNKNQNKNKEKPYIQNNKNTNRYLTSEEKEIRIKEAQNKELFEEFLNQKGRVAVDEFLEIREKNPQIIQKAYNLLDKKSDYNNSFETNPKDIAMSAIEAKTFFDNQELPYRVISVGTSAEPLGSAIEKLGAEVIHLPLSGAMYAYDMYYEPCEEIIDSYPNIKIPFDYLNYKASKEKKMNYIMDFALSGKTLKIVAKFVEDYCKSGETFKYKISAVSSKSYYSDCACEFCEEYSNIPHFDVLDFNHSSKDWIEPYDKSEEEIFREFDEFSKPFARAFELCVMNEIYKIDPSLLVEE